MQADTRQLRGTFTFFHTMSTSLIYIFIYYFQVLSNLVSLLEPVQAATIQFSKGLVPLLSDVLVTFDTLFNRYENLQKNSTELMAVAAYRMLRVLRKYYALSDNCEMYRIAVCEQFYFIFTHK